MKTIRDRPSRHGGVLESILGSSKDVCLQGDHVQIDVGDGSHRDDEGHQVGGSLQGDKSLRDGSLPGDEG